MPDDMPLAGMIGKSPVMREVFQLARLAAASKATVLIIGETGTGKELVARAMHELSPRAGGQYIRVNCGALHENLLESELFGHVKGSFTGAFENKVGRFEAANGGTIFLDEVNSTSTNLQLKLLRVLQEGQLERVGDTRTIHVDVRVVAASNEMLQEKVAAGRFREDLFHRLNVVPIFLPPLRVRREDIEPLAARFLQKFGEENGFAPPALTPELLHELQNRDWPGNVRELENTIERLVVLSRGRTAPMDLLRMGKPRFPLRDGTESKGDDLPALVRKAVRLAVEQAGEAGSLHGQFLSLVERELLRYVLSLCDNVQSKAARLLGLNRNTLSKKLGDQVEEAPESDWMI